MDHDNIQINGLCVCVFLNRKEKRVREREGFVGMKKKRKEKKRNERPDQYIYIYICTKFLAGKSDSSLLTLQKIQPQFQRQLLFR